MCKKRKRKRRQSRRSKRDPFKGLFSGNGGGGGGLIINSPSGPGSSIPPPPPSDDNARYQQKLALKASRRAEIREFKRNPYKIDARPNPVLDDLAIGIGEGGRLFKKGVQNRAVRTALAIGAVGVLAHKGYIDYDAIASKAGELVRPLLGGRNPYTEHILSLAGVGDVVSSASSLVYNAGLELVKSPFTALSSGANQVLKNAAAFTGTQALNGAQMFSTQILGMQLHGAVNFGQHFPELATVTLGTILANPSSAAKVYKDGTVLLSKGTIAAGSFGINLLAPGVGHLTSYVANGLVDAGSSAVNHLASTAFKEISGAARSSYWSYAKRGDKFSVLSTYPEDKAFPLIDEKIKLGFKTLHKKVKPEDVDEFFKKASLNSLPGVPSVEGILENITGLERGILDGGGSTFTKALQLKQAKRIAEEVKFVSDKKQRRLLLGSLAQTVAKIDMPQLEGGSSPDIDLADADQINKDIFNFETQLINDAS